MIKYIALALLLISANAYTINLKQTELPVQNSPIGDILYTSEVNYGSTAQPQRLQTIYDITSQNTWVVDGADCKDCISANPNLKTFNCENDQTCKPYGNLGGASFGFAGQVQFASSGTGAAKKTNQGVYKHATDVLQVEGEQFNKMEIILPQGVAAQPRDTTPVDYFSKAQASIGLGSNYADFIQGLNNKKNNKVEIDGKSFSVYLGAVNQILFGKPEGFFKTGETKTFYNHKETNDDVLKNSYSLKANHIIVGKDSRISLSRSDNVAHNPRTSDTYGIFTSTSKFINFFDASVLQSVVDKINAEANGSANCQEVKNKQYYYTCDAGASLPDLELELTDGKTTKSFKLTPEDYSEKITIEGGVDKKLLLLRRGLTGYQNYQLASFASAGSNQYIWLGYPFLNRFYVNFNYERNDIDIANKFEFETQDKHLGRTNRLLFLIIGGLVTLFAVGYLLSQLTSVPYDPVTMKVNMEQLHSSPQKQIILTNQSQGSPLRYIQASSNKYELRPAQTLSNFVSVPQKQTYFPPVARSERSPVRTYNNTIQQQ